MTTRTEPTPQRTPTPWRVVKRHGSYSSPFYIEDANGNHVCSATGNQLDPNRASIGQVGAAFDLIVRAVNTHAALVEALEHAVSDLRSALDGKYSMDSTCTGVANYLRVALAAAKGKQ